MVGFITFRSFFCKVGALLDAPFHLIALMDLDLILFDSPFRLVDTLTFQQTGTHFFVDRRRVSSNHINTLRDLFTKLWKHFEPYRRHPQGVISSLSQHLRSSFSSKTEKKKDDGYTNINDDSIIIPATSSLGQSAQMTGWSSDYGESGVVLYDKKRHATSLQILTELVSPGFIDSVNLNMYGDKELYWQSLAYAGLDVGMNPWAVSEVGEESGAASNRTCAYKATMAQWVSYLPNIKEEGGAEGAEEDVPHLFYLNCDGVEDLMTHHEDVLYHASISDPLPARSPLVEIAPEDSRDGSCNRGARPFDSKALDAFRLYQSIYDSWEE